MLLPILLLPTLLAAPATWHVQDLSSTATGARTVHVGLSTEPCQGGRETFALATLDADGLHTMDLDWPSLLGTVGSDFSLTIATSPAPTQDLAILFAGGTPQAVHLPSTEHTTWGALFLADPDDGRAGWLDADRDGVAVGDPITASQAQVAQHLAGTPDERAEPVEIAPPADGRALDADTLRRGQRRLLQIALDGQPVHLPDYPGVSSRDGALAPRPADLSGADWTTVAVEPGTIAVGAALGRLRFFADNDLAGFVPLGEWTARWSDPSSACLGGAGFSAITRRESEASVILLGLLALAGAVLRRRNPHAVSDPTPFAAALLLAACDPFRAWPAETEVFPWVYTAETDLEDWEEVRWETETWDPENDPEMAGLYLRKALEHRPGARVESLEHFAAMRAAIPGLGAGLRLSFVGDAMWVGDNWASYAQGAAPLLDGDLRVGNLETPTSPAHPTEQGALGTYAFNAPPEILDGLPLDLLQLNNDHSPTRGRKGSRPPWPRCRPAGSRTPGSMSTRFSMWARAGRGHGFGQSPRNRP